MTDGSSQRKLAALLADALDANFECFVEAYEHRLYGFVLTLVREPAEAQEIAQDSFVAAYRALRGYEPERRRELQLRAWLFTIALNRVRNRSRHAPSLSLDAPSANGVSLAADASDGPEAVAERHERVARLRSALERLAPRYRVPVVLRHLEGMSYDEIAAVLAQPVGTAKANVHRGLALLRGSELLQGANC